MIDPFNVTNFNQNSDELEENLIFWILVAGKTAKVITERLNNFSKDIFQLTGENSHFSAIRKAYQKYGQDKISKLLKKHGIGCYRIKSNTLINLVKADLNLKKCSVEELENIKGIGPKTARCFLIHSRKNAQYAGLDTHILKFLRKLGYKTPKSTPSSPKKYKELEKIFIYLAKKENKSISEYDLEIWKKFARK